MTNSVLYWIQAENPQNHLFEVGCCIKEPNAAGQVVSLPAWIPGSYMIRDFAKNIVQINAVSSGKALALTKLDKSTWRCEPCTGTLEIIYQVYAWDQSVRAARLDTIYGFFNGSSVFLQAHGHEHKECVVDIKCPGVSSTVDWQVATGMNVKKTDPRGFGKYTAQNYDALIDHPVMMGDMQRVPFQAGGIPHEMVLIGQCKFDADRLAQDLKVLCDYHIAFFKTPAPMDRYLFLLQVTTSGYGGLEHRNSSALVCRRDDLPKSGMEQITDAYRTFLGLCSHEYFHAWNVKRIRPQAFTPYDLSTECYTRDLWVFEGITSYYDDMALCRSGLITTESYLELLSQTITRYLRTPGRMRQTLAESSFEAWTKFYKQDENAPNAIVSYYIKGALVALCLDLLIRKECNNKKTLDDVMLLLWQRYGQTGNAVPEGGIVAIVSELCKKPLDDFVHKVLYETGELPLTLLLADHGIDLNVRPAINMQDKGGKPPSENMARTTLGMLIGTNGKEMTISTVYNGSPAESGGLAPGDTLVAIDGIKASMPVIEQLYQYGIPGQQIDVHVFRDDVLHKQRITLQQAEENTAYLTFQETEVGKSGQQKKYWFNSKSSN